MVSLIHRLALHSVIAATLAVGPQSASATETATDTAVPPMSAPDATAPVPDFWSGFHAPELNALIAQGFAANQDVASATARLAAARARLGAARARMRPSASLAVNGQKNITVTGDILQSGLQPNVELDVGYDLDLFGANKSNKRAEKARLAASGLDLAAVRLSLSSEIARAYVNISALDAEMGTLGVQLSLVQRLSGLVDLRTREGEAGAFEAGLVVQQLVTVKAQQQVLIQSRADMVASLAVLLGQEPGQFTFTPESFEKITVPPLDDTQPTDLLARRPDVLAAQQRMFGAKFDAQTIDRQRLPSLRLSASGIVGLITGGGGFGILASAGGTMAAALFQGGAITARRQESSAVARDAAAAYRKTQLNSLREAVSSMAARSSATEREGLWRQSIDAVGRSARVAQSAYLEGEVAINLVVDARGNEIASRRALIQARRDRLGATIDVFRAMGGPPEAAPAASAATPSTPETPSPFHLPDPPPAAAYP